MRRARHAAVLFAAAAHAAYAIVDRVTNPLASHLLHDAARYDDWARAILAGSAFEPGAFSQAPLYPYVVAAIYAVAGPHPWAVVAFQVALGVATVATIGAVATRAFGDRAGAWAAWLTALYGVLPFFETKLLPTAIVVFLVALFMERAQAADASRRLLPWIAAGGVQGFLVVGHSASLLLAPLTVIWIAADRSRAMRDRVLRAMLCLAAAAVVIVPVAVRNHRASGAWILVASNGGVTFWHGNNPMASGVYATPEGFTGAVATQAEESKRQAEVEEGRPLRDDEVSRHWFRAGGAFLVGHLAHAAWLVGRKVLFALSSTEQPLEYSPRLDTNPLRHMFPVPFAAFVGLGIVGCALAWRHHGAKLALLPVAGTLTALIVFYVSARYRLPAIPGLAVLAGAGASAWRERTRTGARSLIPLAVVAAAAVALSLAWFPMSEAELRRKQDAMTLCDLGTAQRETARLDAAVASYRRAIALDPDYPYAHIDLGKTLARAGRLADAEQEAREAVRLAPELFEARFDLGVVQFESGNLSEAAASFREAFRLDPASADAGNNLAGTCLKLGLTDEARETVRAMRRDGLAVDPQLTRALGE